jgi:hypothetical protein
MEKIFLIGEIDFFFMEVDGVPVGFVVPYPTGTPHQTRGVRF